MTATERHFTSSHLTATGGFDVQRDAFDIEVSAHYGRRGRICGTSYLGRRAATSFAINVLKVAAMLEGLSDEDRESLTEILASKSLFARRAAA